MAISKKVSIIDPSKFSGLKRQQAEDIQRQVDMMSKKDVINLRITPKDHILSNQKARNSQIEKIKK